MNRLEKMLSKWNFKKIAVWYLVLAVVAGLICGEPWAISTGSG